MRAWFALLACTGCSQILGIGSFDVADGGPIDTPVDAHLVSQAAYLKASNAQAGDQFGTGVAASADGSTIAVTAYLEDGGTSGVGGNDADNTKLDSGALYVFVRGNGTWTQQAYIKASNTDAGDGFGRSVAISADGNTIVACANLEDSSAVNVGGLQTNVAGGVDSGACYVFARSGVTWVQTAYLKPSNISISEDFGFAVAISGDGTRIAVGAPFEDTGGANAGAVYTFSFGGGMWAAEAKLLASNPGAADDFGYTVSYSTDGTTLAVGAPTEDSAATGIGGVQGDNSALSAGAVYVFTRAGAVYTQEAYVKASNTNASDEFGHGVGLSGDGNLLVVGASGESSGSPTDQADNTAMLAGAGYVFARTGSTWSQAAYIKASNVAAGDNFGTHVAVAANGTAFAISAPGQDGVGNAIMDSGAAYLYTKSGATWTERYLTTQQPSVGDKLEAIGLSGTTVVAGSIFEDSASTGVGGTQTDETAVDSGAAYVFE